MKLYKQTRKCSNCGFREERCIEKTKAAFESERLWNSPCIKCKRRSHSARSCIIPEPDTELLSIWAKSKQLRFLDQDEDIFLGQPDIFDLLVEFVQNETIPKNKRRIILSALCVILHDNSPLSQNDKESLNLDIAQKAKNFLSSKKWLFDQLGEKYISKYIRDVVFKII